MTVRLAQVAEHDASFAGGAGRSAPSASREKRRRALQPEPGEPSPVVTQIDVGDLHLIAEEFITARIRRSPERSPRPP